MKYRQKIDKAASDQLERIISTFPVAWGNAAAEDSSGTFSFTGFGGPGAIALAYDAKKQLLGGIYSLMFTLECAGILWDGEAEATLRYKGRLLKGAAYFAAGKGKSDMLAPMLNEDSELVELLGKLDLLSMKVSVVDKTLRVTLSPMGGAYTYTVFPPMKYGGLLPDKDLELIRQAMVRITADFPTGDVRKAAGAEL